MCILWHGMALCQMPDSIELFINKTKLFKLWSQVWQSKAGAGQALKMNVNVNQIASQAKPVSSGSLHYSLSCLEILKTLAARQVKHNWNQYYLHLHLFLERGKKGRKYQIFAIMIFPARDWISILSVLYWLLTIYWCDKRQLNNNLESVELYFPTDRDRLWTLKFLWTDVNIPSSSPAWVYRPNFNIWVASCHSGGVGWVVQTI